MAARLHKHHQDDIRAKIRTIELIRYLQCGVLGIEYNGRIKVPTLTAPKVNAALSLIRKTLPDLSNIELTGVNGGALTVLLQQADANA